VNSDQKEKEGRWRRFQRWSFDGKWWLLQTCQVCGSQT